MSLVVAKCYNSDDAHKNVQDYNKQFFKNGSQNNFLILIVPMNHWIVQSIDVGCVVYKKAYCQR